MLELTAIKSGRQPSITYAKNVGLTIKPLAQPTFYIVFYSEITVSCFNDLADSAIALRLSSLNGISPFSVK